MGSRRRASALVGAVLCVVCIAWCRERERPHGESGTDPAEPAREPGSARDGWRTAVGNGRDGRDGRDGELDPVLVPVPPGHVRVAGRVHDVRGLGLVGASIELTSDPTGSTIRVVSELDGRFAGVVPDGELIARAHAEGYVDAVQFRAERDHGARPFDLALVPASAIEGRVVDARTGAPVASARVVAEKRETRSGADGGFRLEGLEPGRYLLTATTASGYGEPVESVLATLGSTTSGVTIRMHVVAVVAAHVVIASREGATATRTPCPPDAGEVRLSQASGYRTIRGRTLDDGQVVLEGVVPGTYAVAVECRGTVPQVPYPDLVVGDSDLEDVTWLVMQGARLTGHVRDPGGRPVAGATVNASSSGGQTYASGTSGTDGAFVIEGVAPGAVELLVYAEGYASSETRPQVAASLTGTVATEIVLVPVSALLVEVTDPAREPLAGVEVRIVGRAGTPTARVATVDRTRHDGTVRATLAPGDYDVHAGTVSTPAVVVAATEVRVTVAIAPPSGTLVVAVVGPTGRPVEDAFVALEREDLTSTNYDDRTELVGPDGVVRFDRLVVGSYTVRAYRAGGAEVTERHVATGGTTRLVLRPTGEITGIVVGPDGKPADDVTIEATSSALDEHRVEHVFHSGGRFVVRDLPAGDYELSVDANPQLSVHATLAEGGRVAGIVLTSSPGVAVRGRLAGRDGRARAGWKVELRVPVRTVDHAGGGHVVVSDVLQAVTDEDGRFLFRSVQPATGALAAADVTVRSDAEVTPIQTVVIGTAPIDLGTITVEPAAEPAVEPAVER